MIGIIAAVTKNGVIGLDGKIPFDYKEDMIHFKQTTLNSTVIMGRKTFEGIGKPLPKRRNIVISRIAKALGTLPKEGIEIVSSLEEGIELAKEDPIKNIWLIGGAFVYEQGMQYANLIKLTITPDVENGKSAIRFPWINPSIFDCVGVKCFENNSKLLLATYVKDYNITFSEQHFNK